MRKKLFHKGAHKENISVSFIQEEWHIGEFPYLHGWVYSLENGKIKDLNVTVNNSHALDDIYRDTPRYKR